MSSPEQRHSLNLTYFPADKTINVTFCAKACSSYRNTYDYKLVDHHIKLTRIMESPTLAMHHSIITDVKYLYV